MEMSRTISPMFNHGGWHSNKARLLTEENLMAVFDGLIPAIILPRFISEHYCKIIVENLRQMGMGTYSHVSHPVGRLGLAQMEYHLKNNKSGYFGQVEAATNTYRRAVAGSEDPVQKLMDYLRHAAPGDVSTATESLFGSYFAGSFRNVMSVGHLHYDFAPFEAKGWDIASIESQLSWNLYLNQPVGGDLRVYNRFYFPNDEALRVSGEYFYDYKAVSDVSAFAYTPRIGDVVIFNSRNFHEVKPVTGDRYSLSSFIGRTLSRDLVLWS